MKATVYLPGPTLTLGLGAIEDSNLFIAGYFVDQVLSKRLTPKSAALRLASYFWHL